MSQGPETSGAHQLDIQESDRENADESVDSTTTDGPSALTQSKLSIHRQVSPAPEWIQDGVPSSLAFKPSGKDNGFLSVDRGDFHTPQEAFICFTEQGFHSAGTWTLTLNDYTELDLKVYPQPIPHNIAHCGVDFNPFGNSQRSKKASKLKKKAKKAGPSYVP